ncbi:unnamed protein product [Clonostachys rhizophaga]|uniref:Mid2 domain-containing protein n=1 Tax=Clonostachys rhizophaga TaxID=160324 RepID=A0A9N9YAQ1_9HYPO|nr:unnamed protein product [Clonostachys rhizophaga]
MWRYVLPLWLLLLSRGKRMCEGPRSITTSQRAFNYDFCLNLHQDIDNEVNQRADNSALYNRCLNNRRLSNKHSASATNDEATGGKDETSKLNLGAIIGGVVAGGAVLSVVALIVWICIRRRAKNGSASSEKPRSDRSGFSTIISDPIVQPNSYRTEFILRPPSTPPRTDRQSIPCISEDRITRRSIRNPFNSPNPSDAGTNSRIPSFCEDSPPRQGQVGARLAPIRTMKASSQYLKPQRTSIHRQPSGECINVFADSNAVDDQFNRQTTFTELMDRADLKGVGRDKPYVPGTTPRI